MQFQQAMRENSTRPYKTKVKNQTETGGKQLLTDGGVDSSDLSKFQIAALAILVEEPRYGLAVKRELEEYYGQEVNHGRLYPNLDDLVEYGLVEKSALDKRTNEYAATAAGERVLEEFNSWLDERLGGENEKKLIADGGVDVGPASTSDMDAAGDPGDIQFALDAMSLDDVSVSVEDDRYAVTVRGPDRGALDGGPVIDLVSEHSLRVKDVRVDIEGGALTIEVGR